MSKMVALGKIASFMNGYAFKPTDWGTFGLPIIRIQNLTGSSNEINYYSGSYPERVEINDGDILISWSASLGVYVWQGGKALLNQHIFKVEFNKIEIDKMYFVYAVREKIDEMMLKTHGSTMKHITKKYFDDIKIPLPPMPEQQIIATIFDKTNSLISERKKQLENLDLLVKSRFVEMFGDLHVNDKGWEIKSFSEFAKIDAAMTTEYDVYADYPHIGIDSIESGTGELRGYRTVKQDGVKSGKYIFTPDHIIYSKIRPNLNKVAIPSFDGLCSADAYPILNNSDNCDKIFLAYVLRSELFLLYVLPFSYRTNFPKVNREQITGFSMPLPPLELQTRFADFVRQADKSKFEIQQGTQKLELQYNALMQQYIN